MSIKQLIIDSKAASKQWDRAYAARHTPAQREAKHFDIGYGGYYESDEYVALLRKHGFNSVEEYDAAYATADCVVAYARFNQIMKFEDVTFTSLKADLLEQDLYNEDAGVESGFELYAIAKRHYPKHAQLVELMDELGYQFPAFGFKQK